MDDFEFIDAGDFTASDFARAQLAMMGMSLSAFNLSDHLDSLMNAMRDVHIGDAAVTYPRAVTSDLLPGEPPRERQVSL